MGASVGVGQHFVGQVVGVCSLLVVYRYVGYKCVAYWFVAFSDIEGAAAQFGMPHPLFFAVCWWVPG